MNITVYIFAGIGAFVVALFLLIVIAVIGDWLKLWYKCHFHPVELKVVKCSTPYNFNEYYIIGLWCYKCKEWHTESRATKEQYDTYRAIKAMDKSNLK